MFQRHLGALALVAALVAPLAASAQSAPAPMPPAAGAPVAPGADGQQHQHRHHRHGLMHAMRGLNLSDSQKQQLAGIFKSARAARQQTAGTPPDPATRRANMQAMRSQIDAILTDTQRAKLADNLKRERNHKKGEARSPQSPPQ